MNVLISMVELGVGGTERALMGLLKALDRDNYTVTLLLENLDVKAWSDSIPKNVVIKQLKCDTIFGNAILPVTQPYTSPIKAALLLRIRKLLTKMLGHLHVPFSKRYEFALKHCKDDPLLYDFALDFYGYGNFATAYIAKKIKAKKKATWIHSISLTGCNRTNPFFADYDRVYCVSEATKKEFDRQYSQFNEKTEVFYNYLDIDEIIERSKDCIDDPRFRGDIIIVSVGRLAYEKGYDISIQAAKLLTDRNIQYTWYIIGDGSERDTLQDQIDRLGLNDQFILLGAKENPMPYIRKATLYVQTSLEEGFGLSVTEALVLNKTVIASNIESFREQIEDGVNGYLVDNTPGDVAKKIKEFIQGECATKQAAIVKLKYSNTEDILRKLCSI